LARTSSAAARLQHAPQSPLTVTSPPGLGTKGDGRFGFHECGLGIDSQTFRQRLFIYMLSSASGRTTWARLG